MSRPSATTSPTPENAPMRRWRRFSSRECTIGATSRIKRCDDGRLPLQPRHDRNRSGADRGRMRWSFSSDLAEPANFDRLHSLGAILEFIFDDFPIAKRFEPLSVDDGMMDEDILAFTLGRDEPEPLLVVEPLDLTGGHGPLLSDVTRRHCEDVRLALDVRHRFFRRETLPGGYVSRCQGTK